MPQEDVGTLPQGTALAPSDLGGEDCTTKLCGAETCWDWSLLSQLPSQTSQTSQNHLLHSSPWSLNMLTKWNLDMFDSSRNSHFNPLIFGYFQDVKTFWHATPINSLGEGACRTSSLALFCAASSPVSRPWGIETILLLLSLNFRLFPLNFDLSEFYWFNHQYSLVLF